MWRLIALLGSVGCGPVIDVSGVGQDGGTTSGATTSDAQSISDGSAGSSGALTTTTGPPEPPAPIECEAEYGEDPLSGVGEQCNEYRVRDGEFLELTVEFVNRAEEPVLFTTAGCDGNRVWVDGTVGGREVIGVPSCIGDVSPCDILLGDVLPCDLPCIESGPVVLYPGASLETRWTVRIGASAELPASCSSTEMPAACNVVMPAPPGNYLVHTGAAPQSACRNLADCSCAPDDDGICGLDGRPDIAEPIELTATWDGRCPRVQISYP